MIKWSELRVPNNFKLTEKGVYFIDKNKHHRFLLPPIVLVSGTSSREDGTESYKLQYISSGSQLKERVVPASSLTSREIESWAAFGAYGLRLATYYFIRVQGVVSRQQVLAVVKAAGYTEQVAASAISNAISRKRRQRRLIPVSGRNRPAYYRMFPGFLWENIRIY